MLGVSLSEYVIHDCDKSFLAEQHDCEYAGSQTKVDMWRQNRSSASR